MNKLFCFSLKWKLRQLQRDTSGPFDPEISQQIDCLQYLLETFNRGRRGK